MTYEIDTELALLKAKRRYALDTYHDWRKLAEMIIAYVDAAEAK